ncbi:hypothetical protein HGH92_24580 [Chitinophaga varians]|uniref:Lipoprotein n=1 Tax=Chitinophaga varians TaxID=2202339 RepID=A0A847RZP1_9BACT|nr:hypothetical protein [Chitinophaga varians]NLR67504.1 hypothetical protein [Chitinophaga varians]
MFYRKIYLPLLACTMAACSKSDKETSKDADPADLNSISVSIEGEFNQKIEARGRDVEVALLKFTKTSLEGFGVGGFIPDGNGSMKTEATTGLMKLQLQAGAEQTGTATGSVTVKSGNNQTQYAGQSYFLYYDTDVNAANSKVYLTLTEVKDTANLLKLRGQFRYNAAYGPDKQSDDCIKEALANSGRLPMYNADLCGAKKVKVSGTFTIYLDKVMQQ